MNTIGGSLVVGCGERGASFFTTLLRNYGHFRKNLAICPESSRLMTKFFT